MTRPKSPLLDPRNASISLCSKPVAGGQPLQSAASRALRQSWGRGERVLLLIQPGTGASPWPRAPLRGRGRCMHPMPDRALRSLVL